MTDLIHEQFPSNTIAPYSVSDGEERRPERLHLDESAPLAPRYAARVLVIDPVAHRAADLAWHLESQSIQVQRVSDGWSGMERIADAMPDLIVIGLELDRPDGVKLLEHLMVRRDLATVPIVAVGDRAHSVEPSRFDVKIMPPQARMAQAAEEIIEKLTTARRRGPGAGPGTKVLDVEAFVGELTREFQRRRRGGQAGFLASITIFELPSVRLRLGHLAEARLLDRVVSQMSSAIAPMDAIGLTREDRIGILFRETSPAAVERKIRAIGRIVTDAVHELGEERILLTPSIGWVAIDDGKTAEQVARRAESARVHASRHLDLQAARWDASMDAVRVTAESAAPPGLFRRLRTKLRLPMQIALTFMLGVGVPFFVYLGSDIIGVPVANYAYMAVVFALVTTGAVILYEAHLAVDQKEPPVEPSAPYPKASAIIAAYLPNEAATVLETIESFLALDYPNEVEIILAYNTPDAQPVEERLRELAARHPNFIPVEVKGSTSKAQNINAVLSLATGEFTGVFDADHMPRPDSFKRAWRWLASGYDVVQGHCLTRNGSSSWLTKMVAVEFETIYAVSHPGRARMHDFGIFGGSNGYWRTELLHEIRMRGSMLTEDIDSAMRVVKQGGRIRSDRSLVSRELGTSTLKQVWNQRMRWAQGWFQVSREHAVRGMRSPHLSGRQKLGVFHLLVWREFYPWLSLQILPLLLYSWSKGTVGWMVPVWLATTLFTIAVGPISTWYAYRLADPEIKQHRAWFWGYLLFTTVFYAEFKNLIARVAQIKDLMGEQDWRVTPRSADPS